MVKRQSTDIIDFKRGSVDIEKIYRESTLLWERSAPPPPDAFLYVFGDSNVRGNIIEKYDFDGNLLASISSLNSSTEEAKAAKMDLNGNIYLGRGNGRIDIIDSDLNRINGFYNGNTSYISAIDVDFNNGNIAVGNFAGSLRVYNSSFGLIYSKTGLFRNSLYFREPVDTKFDNSGNLYVTGFALDDSGTPELYKYDSSGNEVWTYTTANTNKGGRFAFTSDYSYLYFLHSDSNTNQAYIAKIDPSTDSVIYDLPVVGTAILDNYTHGIIIDGSDIYYTSYGCTTDDGNVFKYTEVGNTLVQQWVKYISMAQYCRASGAELDNFGGLYAAYQGTSPGFAKFDVSDGSIQWQVNWSGSLSNRPYELRIYPRPFGINI